MTSKIGKYPVVVAAGNLLLVMTIYTLSRVLFYRMNHDWYTDIPTSHLLEMMAGGLRFDLTAVLYLSSLYLLLMLLPLPGRIRQNPMYRKVTRWSLWIPQTIGIIANTIDTVYVRFTDRRTTMATFSEFSHDGNIAQIIGEGMIQYLPVTIVGILLIALLVAGYREGKEQREDKQENVLYYLRETAILLVSVYFIVIGIRGGFGAWTRPINISNAMQYADTPQESMLVLNTPFSIIETIQVVGYTEPSYFPQDELERRMTPIHTPKPGEEQTITKCNEIQPGNVVVLILESFAKEHIGFYNRHLDNGTYQGYTPFLDSLLAESITYRYSFASGRKSIDAMPSVLSSIPMLIEPYTTTPYATNRVSSIADCLRRKGYTTAFFHGAPNGSMGFQAYARAAGFEHYYGMDEYDGEDAFDGTWAIWDEEFLQYFGRTMSTMSEPFMTAVFTASSHHPFRIPSRYEGVFPKGSQPLQECIGYSDMALRRFFEYAKQRPWFANTLFVLTADHTNQLCHTEYQNERGLYEVPIAFYQPGVVGRLDTINVISHTDIMPSVLAATGYDEPYFAFGEDALTQNKQHNYAICYNYPLYQLMTNRGTLLFDGEQVVADNTNNAEAIPYLKAYIQQYIHRMIHNELTWQK